MIPQLANEETLEQAIDMAYAGSRRIAERERNRVLKQLWGQWISHTRFAPKVTGAANTGHDSQMSCL